MSANPHRAGGLITVDWTIIALSLLALALLLATTIRTDTMRFGSATDAGAGLRILTAQERLVAFEDFSFGTHDWTVAEATPGADTVPSLLGPFAGGTIAKSYALPRGTARVTVTLDLYVADAKAAETLIVEVNGAAVLQGLVPTTGDAGDPATMVRAPDGPGPRNPWTVRITLPQPGTELTLRLRDGGADAGDWGLDNVWVVAESAGRAP
jgi:hypothetical protein